LEIPERRLFDILSHCPQEISGALSERIARSAREDVCIPLLPKENREDPQCAGAILRLMRAAAKVWVLRINALFLACRIAFWFSALHSE
jgi:hypothetical protein